MPNPKTTHRNSMKKPPPAHQTRLFSAGVPQKPGATAFVIGHMHGGRVMAQGGGEYMGARWWWYLPDGELRS